jgi:hypothetical protein
MRPLDVEGRLSSVVVGRTPQIAVLAQAVLACERALAAGVASSRYVERLLKADRRHPFLDAHAAPIDAIPNRRE